MSIKAAIEVFFGHFPDWSQLLNTVSEQTFAQALQAS